MNILRELAAGVLFSLFPVFGAEFVWAPTVSQEFREARNWMPEGIPGPGDTARFGNATVRSVEGGEPIVVARFLCDGGMNYLGAPVVVTERLELIGSSVMRGGLRLEAGSTSRIYSGPQTFDNLENHGTMILEPWYLIIEGTFNNAAAGVVDVVGSRLIGNGRLINRGQFRKTGTLADTYVDLIFDNYGHVFAEGAVLVIQNGGIINGSYEIWGIGSILYRAPEGQEREYEFGPNFRAPGDDIWGALWFSGRLRFTGVVNSAVHLTNGTVTGYNGGPNAIATGGSTFIGGRNEGRMSWRGRTTLELAFFNVGQIEISDGEMSGGALLNYGTLVKRSSEEYLVRSRLENRGTVSVGEGVIRLVGGGLLDGKFVGARTICSALEGQEAEYALRPTLRSSPQSLGVAGRVRLTGTLGAGMSATDAMISGLSLVESGELWLAGARNELRHASNKGRIEWQAGDLILAEGLINDGGFIAESAGALLGPGTFLNAAFFVRNAIGQPPLPVAVDFQNVGSVLVGGGVEFSGPFGQLSSGNLVLTTAAQANFRGRSEFGGALRVEASPEAPQRQWRRLIVVEDRVGDFERLEGLLLQPTQETQIAFDASGALVRVVDRANSGELVMRAAPSWSGLWLHWNPGLPSMRLAVSSIVEAEDWPATVVSGSSVNVSRNRRHEFFRLRQ